MESAPSSAGTLWRDFFRDVADNELHLLAAAIAYYTILSLSPLVLLSLALLGTLYPSAQEKFLLNVSALVGAEGEAVIRSIIQSASERPDLRQLAGWIGTGVLLFGASGVFAQLQRALNRIWRLRDRTRKGVLGFLRRRFLSAGVLLAVLFLTLVSFVMQALLNMMTLPESGLLQALWWVFSFLLYSVLFTMLYHWLPDERVPWWTAFRGGLLTTALFLLGRYLFGLYLSHSDTAGAFGPAGALVVWLLWGFYTALVFLLSAELLYAIARHRGWPWAKAPPKGQLPA